MLSVKKLRDELYYWNHIGIGRDIVDFSSLRPEYRHLVKKYLKLKTDSDEIPYLVLQDLNDELRLPAIIRPTFYHLLLVKIQKTSGALCRYIANMINSLIQRH